MFSVCVSCITGPSHSHGVCVSVNDGVFLFSFAVSHVNFRIQAHVYILLSFDKLCKRFNALANTNKNTHKPIGTRGML